MGIEHPSPEVVRAIEGAVAWFRGSRDSGIRGGTAAGAGYSKGFDNVVVADAAAPPLWARFYELGTTGRFFADAIRW